MDTQAMELDREYDLRAQATLPPTLHRMRSLEEAQNDHTRRIQAMVAQQADVIRRSNLAATVQQQQQPQQMMTGLQADGFPLWNSAPVSISPIPCPIILIVR